jgi:Tol biopolymer transport system component
VGVDGGGLPALTQFKPPPNEANDFWSTVAPDGRIAFGRFGAGGITSQVYVMGAAGAGAHAITPPALLAIPGEWTPDSRQVLINSNGFVGQGSRLNAAIYRVRPDGTGLRRLTRPAYPHNDILPSPSPAGDRVVFVSDRRYPDLCCNDLYVVRSDGSELHRVPTGDLSGVGNPDWGSAPRLRPARQRRRCDRDGDRLTAVLAGRVGDRRRPAVRPWPGAPADRGLRHAVRSPQARRPVTRTAAASGGWGTGPRPDRHATPVPVR